MIGVDSVSTQGSQQFTMILQSKIFKPTGKIPDIERFEAKIQIWVSNLSTGFRLNNQDLNWIMEIQIWLYVIKPDPEIRILRFTEIDV